MRQCPVANIATTGFDTAVIGFSLGTEDETQPGLSRP